MSDKKDKGYKDQDDLLREIRAVEPDYITPEIPDNVFPLRPPASVENLIPIEFDDLELETPPPVELVVHPFLPVQGIAFVYAAAGVGKTLFTLNLAYAIAGGGNFLHYTCPLPRRVLYVDGEMAFSQLHSRLMQIKRQQGELDFKKNLLILTPDKVFPFRVPLIDDEKGQETYVHLLDKYKIDVLILDNFSMLTSIDENKSNEFKIVQDWLLFLRSQGKTIINVHHAGKDKLGYRGSSRILDCADAAISLQPLDENCLEDENIRSKKFKVVYQKARNFGGKDALPFEISLENGLWTYASMEQTDLHRVVDMVNLKITQMSIAKELGCGQSKIAKLVKKARSLGLLF